MESSGICLGRLGRLWKLLVVASAFADINLVYELSTSTQGTFRDVVFGEGARSVKDL